MSTDARSKLRDSLYKRSESLNFNEKQFLEQLLENNSDLEKFEKAEKVLQNEILFPEPTNHLRRKSSSIRDLNQRRQSFHFIREKSFRKSAKKLQIDTSELSEDDIFTDPFFTTTRPQYDHNKSISEPLTADILESLRSDGEMDGAFINNDVGSSNNDGVQEVKPRMSPISRGSSLPVDVLRKTHARKSAAKLCRNQNALWKAHQDGVAPSVLKEKSSRLTRSRGSLIRSGSSHSVIHRGKKKSPPVNVRRSQSLEPTTESPFNAEEQGCSDGGGATTGNRLSVGCLRNLRLQPTIEANSSEEEEPNTRKFDDDSIDGRIAITENNNELLTSDDRRKLFFSDENNNNNFNPTPSQSSGAAIGNGGMDRQSTSDSAYLNLDDHLKPYSPSKDVFHTRGTSQIGGIGVEVVPEHVQKAKERQKALFRHQDSIISRSSELDLHKADSVHSESILESSPPPKFVMRPLRATSKMEGMEVQVDDWSTNNSDESLPPPHRLDDDSSSCTASSWSDDNDDEHFDAWAVLKDDYAIGYGGAGSLPFRILGTSADDIDSHPHVLSPPLMESLQQFLPYALTSDNFWMKYSLLRDGADMYTLLRNVRGAKYTILAIETMDGRVFGSFNTMPWRKSWNFFGTGESFVWKMRRSRLTPSQSVLDQAVLESELDVFPATGENQIFQICTSSLLGVGGGGDDTTNDQMLLCHHHHNNDDASNQQPSADEEEEEELSFGFALALTQDLLMGTSSPCATYGNPCLSNPKRSSLSTTNNKLKKEKNEYNQQQLQGDIFQVANLEIWTLTPCMTEEEAIKLELGKLFLSENT